MRPWLTSKNFLLKAFKRIDCDIQTRLMETQQSFWSPHGWHSPSRLFPPRLWSGVRLPWPWLHSEPENLTSGNVSSCQMSEPESMCHMPETRDRDTRRDLATRIVNKLFEPFLTENLSMYSPNSWEGWNLVCSCLRWKVWLPGHFIMFHFFWLFLRFNKTNLE